ncbi:MAG TPA: FMN-dependent NADH-azoreductase [Stellaceae bacterium]|jgi:FMN-dependent NADH-azoreductase|nr:FMN-dependent NADH-azoreductase [Stellaceae bacterium]
MSSLLLVTSSLFGKASQSRRIAEELVAALREKNPDMRVVERDLTPLTMPHLSTDTLMALATPAEQYTPAQREAVAFADALIEEVEAAATIVVAAPMYNFTIPSTLKAWLDHIARRGRTFRYGAAGPEGLLKGKKVFVITGRGGIYSGESPVRALDFQEPYLRAILGFIGLTDVSFVHVEGLNINQEEAEKGRTRARQAIATLLPKLAA